MEGRGQGLGVAHLLTVGSFGYSFFFNEGDWAVRVVVGLAEPKREVTLLLFWVPGSLGVDLLIECRSCVVSIVDLFVLLFVFQHF